MEQPCSYSHGEPGAIPMEAHVSTKPRKETFNMSVTNGTDQLFVDVEGMTRSMGTLVAVVQSKRGS